MIHPHTNKSCFTNLFDGDNKYTANDICKVIDSGWIIIYMLGLVESLSNRRLAFPWGQTVPHYWLTCFSIPMRMSS